MASPKDPPVQRAIAEAIRDHGPITFAEYMGAALYGPGGFYERPPVGPGGDFVTSPHIHPVFAELLAKGLRELWDLLGRPEPLRLVEVGAGDGTLAVQLLEHLGDLPLDYTAVERSAGAWEALATVPGVHPAAALPDAPHVVFANELLDNLPFRRVRMGPHGPVEVCVGLDEGRLAEVLSPPDDAVRAAADGLDDGEETVVAAGALDFVDALAATLTHGYALLIDYGAEGGTGGATHGYRSHRVLDDPLDRPGSADLTAGVDFAVVAGRARAHGLQAFPAVTQRRALSVLGFEAWTRAELERQHQLLDARDGIGAVQTWSARSRSTLLVDPAALGRFRWLVLASPGLPIPAWLADASIDEPPFAPLP
jgi:NADH dehydrogenase [ubiquinone] 1 alpha subcomplex assembly factor 7